ncbi:hypothetical protein [Stenotrophomonas sp. HMWF023]|uniref:hypothetical protein n=1 Tax=Stenotrophomonas sp. HMWF023 TaxID=2056859 RepID=UPI0011B26178|nr:hypothetical protein [Stenotrophomonas sp. HMWF023]
MLAEISITQHSKLNEFITALSNRGMDSLVINFNLSRSVIDEIFDALPVYLSPNYKLSAPPISSQYGEFPLIVAYKTEVGDISVECYIVGNDEPGEAILHVVFFAATPGDLHYEFINS